MEGTQSPNMFEGLSKAEFTALTQAAEHRRADLHGTFFQQGDRATSWHVLLDGRVRIFELTPKGKQVTHQYVSPGGVFGMVDTQRSLVYPLTAEAVEASHSLSWPLKDLAQQLRAYPTLAVNLVRSLACRMRDLQERCRDLASHDVEERLALELLRLARETGQRGSDGVRIPVALTGPDLADLSGTTLYSVSRVLARWKQDGVLERRQKHLILHDVAGLERIAGNGHAEDAIAAEPTDAE